VNAVFSKNLDNNPFVADEKGFRLQLTGLLRSIEENIQAELAPVKPAETEQNAKRIIAAIFISLILILLFELFVYSGPVTWFRNHPRTYGIQGSIICLIPCLIFGLLQPRWRKWCWRTAALALLVGLLSLL
jgi:hypothetical protein